MSGPLLKVENLTKTYISKKGKAQALQGVSFELEKGEFISVLGPSGSGKSTLLRLMGGLERPTSGRVAFDQEEISSFRNNRRARIRNRKVGYIFPPFNLLPRASARKNVELPLVYAGIGPKERSRRAREELEALGLREKLHFWPAQLTPGEQFEVAVARALVTKPLVILADEPLGLLDSNSEAEAMSVLERLNRLGKALVLATHRQHLADHATRVITLLDGKIVADRPVSDRKSAIRTLLEKE